jgi:ATP-binding cassette subfamily B protein
MKGLEALTALAATDGLERAAARLGFDIERRQIAYRDIPGFIEQNKSVLFETKEGLREAREGIRGGMFAAEERELRESLAPALAGLAPAARNRALAALTADHLAKRAVTAYRVRPAVTSPWARLARESGWIPILVRFALCEGARIGLWVLAWKLLFTEPGGSGWILALLAIVPFHLLALWQQSTLAIEFSRTLKQRMLASVLRLDPEALSVEGASAILGTVNESATLEGLALSGGFQALVGAMELIAAAMVLAASPWGSQPLAALCVWTLLAAWIAWRFYQVSRRWTRERLRMTDSLVERMIGHRTRLAQEHPARWHEIEDRELSGYAATSWRRDHGEAWLTAVAADGWLLLGLASISGFGLASLGGVLLAHAALKALTAGASQLAVAAAGYERVLGLLRKPRARDPEGSAAKAPAMGAIEVAHLEYRHADAAGALLTDCNVAIPSGARVVLEGASGGGKSTFAALVAGVREPSSGAVTVAGRDRGQLGAEAWRRVVALAPQFHQNHVFTGPLAFNLLTGAPEPWTEDRVRKSYAIANELGLRPLIERMPAGMLQVLGETGWQLSQGERSRVFIARTLLQEAPLVILDESLAALDPRTYELVLQCVEKRADSVLLIAHR